MNVTFMKEHIVEGLQKAVSILPSRTGTAYLRSVWLKAENDSLIVMGTDANIEFSGTYTAEVAEAGLVGVQGRAFGDLIRQLPSGKVHIFLDAESGNLRLEQGRRKYTLPVNDAVWFQEFSQFPSDNATIWSGSFLQDTLDRVVFCISDDSAVEAIACLYMKNVGNGRIDVCGLNGHQFAMVNFTNEDLAAHLPEEGVFIQKKYMQEVKKWLSNEDFEMAFSEKRVYMRTLDNKECLSLPRSVHVYPEYTVFMGKVKAEDVSRLSINRKESIDALSRTSIFNTDTDRSAYFDLSENEVVLSSQGQDGSANESIEIEYAGTVKRIAFPPRSLVEIFGHFSSDTVDLVFTSVEGPCGITGKDDPNYNVIIMPMKLNEPTYYSEEDD